MDVANLKDWQIPNYEYWGGASAAVDVATHAMSRGLRVFVIFFIRASHENSEYDSLQNLQVNYKVYSRPQLTRANEICSEDCLRAKRLLEHVHLVIFGGDYDLIILDEVHKAVSWGLIHMYELMDLVRHKPHGVGLIFTGLSPSPDII